MNLRDEVEVIKSESYSEANAEAKLCQDIILKAISESGMGRNATIKGGVVMRGIYALEGTISTMIVNPQF